MRGNGGAALTREQLFPSSCRPPPARYNRDSHLLGDVVGDRVSEPVVEGDGETVSEAVGVGVGVGPGVAVCDGDGDAVAEADA